MTGRLIDKIVREETTLEVSMRDLLDISADRVGPSFGQSPRDDRRNCTDEEEVRKSMVEFPGRILEFRTNHSPYDTRSSKDLSVWTGKLIRLVFRADVGYILEQPLLDTELHCSGYGGGYRLRNKEYSWGDFHVVTELVIGAEL